MLNVSKKHASAQRVKDVSQLKRVFSALGSNLNPTLTQLAKTKRAVFVEGLDFQVFGVFARLLGHQRVANRADFAVVQIQGFNPKRAVDLAAGIDATIGSRVGRAVVLDRDYRSDAEIAEVTTDLSRNGFIVHIHGRKELENYLLEPTVIGRAVDARLTERARRLGEPKKDIPDVVDIMGQAMNDIRHDVFAQLQAREFDFLRRKSSPLDQATITADISKRFELAWTQLLGRVAMVPGKEVLAKVNSALQSAAGVSVSDMQIAAQFRLTEVHPDIRSMVEELSAFGASTTKD